MRMFLLNELVLDDKTRKQMTKSELEGACCSFEVLEMKRNKSIMTATFAALQNLFCTEARQGRSELQQVSNSGE